MIRVALIDDHKVVRIGLKYVLTMDAELELVGEASDASDVIGFIDKTKPDVLLLDVLMPGKTGIEALAEIKAKRPGVKVVMLTTSDAEEDVYSAINGGALGYVMKDKDPDDIVKAIRLAHAGKAYLPRNVQDIYEMRRSSAGLTQREIEIVSYVAKGFSNKEISGLLGIAPNTAKMHLSNIFEKLGACDRASAVSTAIARGLIRLALIGGLSYLEVFA